jgi:hypothetical protein
MELDHQECNEFRHAINTPTMNTEEKPGRKWKVKKENKFSSVSSKP